MNRTMISTEFTPAQCRLLLLTGIACILKNGALPADLAAVVKWSGLPESMAVEALCQADDVLVAVEGGWVFRDKEAWNDIVSEAYQAVCVEKGERLEIAQPWSLLCAEDGLAGLGRRPAAERPQFLGLIRSDLDLGRMEIFSPNFSGDRAAWQARLDAAEAAYGEALSEKEEAK